MTSTRSATGLVVGLGALLGVFGAVGVFPSGPAGGQQGEQQPKDGPWPPATVFTPDKVETRIGTLNFRNGVPGEATTDKVYDHLDFT